MAIVAMRAVGANSAPKEAARRTIRRDTVSTARQSVRSAQSYFIPVSFTTVDQRCASLRMKAENSAGVLVAGNRPEASAFALTAGSAKIFATFRLQLVDDGRGRVPGRNKSEPDRDLIHVRHLGGDDRKVGYRRERARIEFGENAERPALNQRERCGRPVEGKIHTPGEHGLRHFG